MTTTRLLSDLFRAIGAEDLQAASSAAIKLCKAEEEKGHHSAAKQLRGALKGTTGTVVSTQATAFLASALVKLKSDVDIDSVMLPPRLRSELKQVEAEWLQTAALQIHGISPRSKLLFHGPPGCGKSVTAQALGRLLKLPVFLVRFDAIIGAFLGQTAIHLRQLFSFVEANPCVLLLDELDALGKRRGNPLDVGELDRIVISLLQELEHSNPLGLIVGTTNLASHLDDALWRRFDLTLEFKRPTKSMLKQYVQGLTKKFNVRLEQAALNRALASVSYADAERAVVDEVRRQIVRSKR